MTTCGATRPQTITSITPALARRATELALIPVAQHPAEHYRLRATADFGAVKRRVSALRREAIRVERPGSLGVDDAHVGDRLRAQAAELRQPEDAGGVPRQLLQQPRPAQMPRLDECLDAQRQERLQ